MSRRNTLEAKRLRRALKTMREKPPRYINLIDYLKIRGRMSTGRARKIIAAGCVKVDSHVVGLRVIHDDDGFKTRVVDPFVPADWRYRIQLAGPDVEAVKALR